jgi:hypothetical protein
VAADAAPRVGLWNKKEIFSFFLLRKSYLSLRVHLQTPLCKMHFFLFFLLYFWVFQKKAVLLRRFLCCMCAYIRMRDAEFGVQKE